MSILFCITFPSEYWRQTPMFYQDRFVCMPPAALMLWSEDVESIFREKIVDLWRPFSASVHKHFLPVGWDHSLMICVLVALSCFWEDGNSWMIRFPDNQTRVWNHVIKQIIQSSDLPSLDMVSPCTHLGLRIPQSYSSYTGCHLHSLEMCSLRIIQALCCIVNGSWFLKGI